MADAPPNPRFLARSRPVHPLPVDYTNRCTIIFLTVCTKNRQAVLANETNHQHLLAAWRKADHWLVGRYVIMPDHVHLFCSPSTIPAQPMDSWVRFWKSLVTKSVACGEGLLWQTDFWDSQLRRRNNYDAKWKYVLNNPVRAAWRRMAVVGRFRVRSMN
jgi:REP element-mobilizing transposase RayT